MKERPIIFSGEMVRAILDGRKTQTRRIVKPQPNASGMMMLHNYDREHKHHAMQCDGNRFYPCRFGMTGDRLWVRETHYIGGGLRARYLASPEVLMVETGALERAISYPPKRWRPSIHMPRWASRITLEVTGVRVERVQGISGPDCIAEGIAKRCRLGDGPSPSGDLWADTKNDYRLLWEKINGAGSWAANPWVWVVEFKVVEAKPQ